MLLTLLQQTLLRQMCACPFHRNIARMSRYQFQAISMSAICRGWRDSTDLHPACGVDGSIDRFCPKAGLTILDRLLPAKLWVPIQETQFYPCRALRRPLRYRRRMKNYPEVGSWPMDCVQSLTRDTSVAGSRDQESASDQGSAKAKAASRIVTFLGFASAKHEYIAKQ